jgi:hypothetical protein
MPFRDKDQPINAVHCENGMKHIHTPHWQIAETINVKAGSSYIYLCLRIMAKNLTRMTIDSETGKGSRMCPSKYLH